MKEKELAMPKTELNHEQIKRDLQARIDNAATAEIMLTAERDDVSFSALVLKEAGAIKRLVAINEEMHRVAAESASLKAALSEAGRRADAVRADELAAAQRERAAKALPIAKGLAERGAKMDTAIAENCTEFAGLQSDIAELARLGVPMPSRELVMVNLRNANDAALMFLDPSYKMSRPVPPNRRHGFAGLAAGWTQPALSWISGKLNKTAAKSAA
jgi:hypothetical protein